MGAAAFRAGLAVATCRGERQRSLRPTPQASSLKFWRQSAKPISLEPRHCRRGPRQSSAVSPPSDPGRGRPRHCGERVRLLRSTIVGNGGAVRLVSSATLRTPPAAARLPGPGQNRRRLCASPERCTACNGEVRWMKRGTHWRRARTDLSAAAGLENTGDGRTGTRLSPTAAGVPRNRQESDWARWASTAGVRRPFPSLRGSIAYRCFQRAGQPRRPRRCEHARGRCRRKGRAREVAARSSSSFSAIGGSFRRERQDEN